MRQARVAYGKLHVTKEPKTARSRRQIPLSPVAVEALRTHGTRQKREKPATGPTYARTMAWRSPTRLATRSTRRPSRPPSAGSSATRGSPGSRSHGARHSFATVALEAGVDVPHVAAMLGHSSPAITQSIYQHARPERLRKAVDAIAGAIGSG